MIDNTLIQTIGFTVPIVWAWVCILLLVIHLDARTVRMRPEKMLHLLLIGAYFIASLGWFGLVLYLVYPQAFIYYQPVFLLALMLDQVMFYHFVRIITATGEKSGFSPLHYAVPVLLTLVSLALHIGYFSGHPAFSFVAADNWTDYRWQEEYVGMSLVFIVYNSLYPALSLIRIRQYRHKVVDYSADSRRSSLGWLSAMMILILISIPLPLAALLLQIDVFDTLHLTWTGALPTSAVYLILCYNLLSDNYVIIEPVMPHEASEPIRTTLDKHRFERYVREKKPYLNPKLRITDMAYDLHTNRSYLSAFINGEYKMNFSRYINRCRLQELNALRASPYHAAYTNMDLVLLAGFSDYRSYVRTKTGEDKSQLLKVF